MNIYFGKRKKGIYMHKEKMNILFLNEYFYFSLNYIYIHLLVSFFLNEYMYKGKNEYFIFKLIFYFSPNYI